MWLFLSLRVSFLSSSIFSSTISFLLELRSKMSNFLASYPKTFTPAPNPVVKPFPIFLNDLPMFGLACCSVLLSSEFCLLIWFENKFFTFALVFRTFSCNSLKFKSFTFTSLTTSPSFGTYNTLQSKIYIAAPFSLSFSGSRYNLFVT